MKKPVQVELNMTQKGKSVQVQPWVNTALNAKCTPKESKRHVSGRMVELNMSFSKNILNRR